MLFPPFFPFTENGTFESEGVAFADDFTGTFTRSIADGRVYTSNGTWKHGASSVAETKNASVIKRGPPQITT